MKKIIKIIKRNWTILVILGLWLSIVVANFTPDTWLSGWDNLFPEFNFGLNINRSILAVWQEYQGLGLLGGMGHAADLPRQLFLWLTSLVLPKIYLRYFFHLLMLLIGPLGLYFLLDKCLLKRFEEGSRRVAILIGSIFYLFNLAILQMFYVSFEPYSVHFAFLPWLFLANLNFLDKGSKKSFLLLFLVNILAIPQGYIATFFLVYFIALITMFIVYLLREHGVIKRTIVALILLISVNAFWLLPNLYFTVDNVQVNIRSKVNQMSTENKILENKKYGDISNSTILKSFLFENLVAEKDGEAKFLLDEWVSHLDNPFIRISGYLIFLISMLGILISIKQRVKEVTLFIPVFLFGFVILASDTPVLSTIDDLLFRLPLFSQIFRTPFTKLSILVVFCLSIFYPILYLTIALKLKKRLLNSLAAVVFIFLPIVFIFPIFQGKFFYEKNKIEMPREYSQVFNFFQNQNLNTRIANFPQNTYWGWTKYSWGYSGSGFLWYGINQPILDRAFDVWSDKDENYYWEISYALYSKNQDLFKKVLEKYQINWLLVDGNVINPSSPKTLFFDELEELISKSEKIHLVQEFGKIKIYKVNLETPVKDFVFMAENLPQIEPKYSWNNYDYAYLENDNYISTTGNWKMSREAGSRTAGEIGNLTYYPFRSLFTGRGQEDLEFEIEDRGEDFLFRKAIPEPLKNYQLSIPEDGQKELVWVDPQDLSKVRYLKPEVKIKDNIIEVIVPKVGGYYGTEIDPTEESSVQKAINCQEYLGGQVANEVIEKNGQKYLRLISLDAKNCGTAFWLPNLPHNLSYLITVESWNIEGKSLLFWLENLNSRKADLETYLPKDSKLLTSYFIQPVMEEDGLGYTLHFDNLSIGRVKSVNDLGKISVNPIPYKFLTSLKLVNPQAVVVEPQLYEPLKVSHPNPSNYEIQLSAISYKPSAILVLSQAYHSGWLAWEGRPFIGKRLQHVEVNNWENGWILNGGKSPITILFWPQLLEYFGFILLGGTLIGVGIYCLRKN